jgi:hypothetical protein
MDAPVADPSAAARPAHGETQLSAAAPTGLDFPTRGGALIFPAMRGVFISYKREGQMRASSLCAHLEEAGLLSSTPVDPRSGHSRWIALKRTRPNSEAPRLTSASQVVRRAGRGPELRPHSRRRCDPEASRSWAIRSPIARRKRGSARPLYAQARRHRACRGW